MVIDNTIFSQGKIHVVTHSIKYDRNDFPLKYPFRKIYESNVGNNFKLS